LGVSNPPAGFNPNPNVANELDLVVRNSTSNTQGIYPGLILLDQAFSLQALKDNLLGRKILHIAAPEKYLPNHPEEDFLLLGTGEKLKLAEIPTLPNLNNVHLVVLSALETNPNYLDGGDIVAITSYLFEGGVKSVIPSLWVTNDAAGGRNTAQLLQLFYRNLAQGNTLAPVTKTAALQQAQLTFLQNPKSSHPFYWATFTIIGNSL
jgi:CHAT domain-containing protein